MQNSCIAIIPARSGSKRIPGKNIKRFCGKPIIAYSIETALNSSLFDEVMVSTDDEEIASISKSYGASVPFLRSEKNSDDYATTVDVILEVLECYNKKGVLFDYGCCIYPSAPFVTKEILEKSFLKMIENRLDSIFPVQKYSYPIQRALKLDEDEKIELIFSNNAVSRTQDLEEAYHDAGQFYWFGSETVQKQEQVWTKNTGVVILSELEAHDIDTLSDWTIAELKYKNILHAKATGLP